MLLRTTAVSMMDGQETAARRRASRLRGELDGSSTRRITPAEGFERFDALSRRRPGSQPFGARLEATCASVGITAEDDVYIQTSRPLVAAHVDDVADEIYRHLRTRPELAAQFSDHRGAVDRGRLAAHRVEVREWLVSVVNDPLDAETGEYLAHLGHAHVRPRNDPELQMKARYLVETVARVQVLFLDVLARAYADPEELAKCVAAWSRRLMVHLDILLAVYSATQGTPHWY